MAKTITISPTEQNIQNNLENSNNDSKKATDFRALKYLQKNTAIVSICALALAIVLLIITITLLVNLHYGPFTINIVSKDVNTQNNQSTVTDIDYQNPSSPTVNIISEDRNSIQKTQKSPSTITDIKSKNSSLEVMDPIVNLTLSGKFKIVSRLEWLAQPPVEPPDSLDVPVPYVIIHHTATEKCSSQAQCVFHVRFIQTFHMEARNWWDIGYNFLVGGDGEAYEGRGWKAEGAHTYGYNSKSIGIAFIGSFNSLKPPQRQITACKLLIAKGVELGYIKKDYKLLAARQLHTTQSPGAALYEDMKTWYHWSKTP